MGMGTPGWHGPRFRFLNRIRAVQRRNALSPDAAWVSREQLSGLTTEQKQRFLPLCPDVVVELRSPTDSFAILQEKMQEYLKNGARLGWLIDPESKQVHVYRPDETVRALENPESISGDHILPGFVLSLKPIWRPGF